FHCVAGISPKARQLAARHLQLWTDPTLRRRELEKMRASNAEWDFMGRSFLVWSLANMGLREPAAKQTYLAVIDHIIDETRALERERGMCFFLMPYAKARPYEIQPARSLFLDGEIALMMAARRVLEEKPEYKTAMTERIHFMVERMQGNPLPITESYPNECWMFARDQYQRARKELGRTVCGFGYAREWPGSWQGPMDIDSGPIVPVLQISAGSSGMAFIGASAFQDDDFLSSLGATLDFAAFPARK